MKHLKFILPLLLILGASLTLSGCFSGGSSPSTTSTATITGTVSVPSSYTVVAKAPSTWEKIMAMFATPKVAAASGEVPLPGAKVMVLNFADGTPYANLTATTDSNGKYTISGLPSRADVVVVVTVKLNDGREIRLARVLTDIAGSVLGDLDSASSLASEELCILMAKGHNLASGEATRIFEAARTAVEGIIAEGGTIDLTVGGTLFNTKLGDGLVLTSTDPNYNKIIVVLGSMPADATISASDLEYAKLRAAVQDIRSLGISMSAPLDGRILAFNEKINPAINWSSHVRYDWASMLADFFYETLFTYNPEGNVVLQTDSNTAYNSSGVRTDASLGGKWKIMCDPNQQIDVPWTQAVETWVITKMSSDSFSFSATDAVGTLIASGTLTRAVDASGPKMVAKFDYIKDALITEQATATVTLMQSDSEGAWNPRGIVFSCSSFTYEEDMSAMASASTTVYSVPLMRLTSNNVGTYGSMNFTGSITQVMDTANGYTYTSNGEPHTSYPTKYGEVAGTLSMGDSTSFEVKFKETITNTATYPNDPSNWIPEGTDVYDVSVKLPDQLPVVLHLSFPFVTGQVSSAYTFSYTRDTCKLDGSITPDSATNTTTIELSNQDGVVISITGDGNGNILNGTITKGTAIATITSSNGVVTITYPNSSYVESL